MGGLGRWIRGYPVASYVVAAYALSWTAWGLQATRQDPMGTVGTICFLLGGLGPLFAAGLLARVAGTGAAFLARLTRWRTAAGWYVVALLGPALVLGGVALLASLWTTGDLALDEVRPLATLPGLVVSGLLLGGLEEPGWRGFAQERLQRRHGAFLASLVVGLVWIGWHLPLFAIPGTAQASTPFVPFAVMGLGLAVVFASGYNSTGGSVPVVIVLHGAFNGALGWSGLVGPGAGEGAMWLVAGTVCTVALGIVLLAGPTTLARDRADQGQSPRAS